MKEDIKEATETTNEKMETKESVKEEPIISKEKAERIMNAERISVQRPILEALVGFPLEFLSGYSKEIDEFSNILAEANDNPRKRKVSIKISEFGPFITDLIKFMFRFQGVVMATQRDMEVECYNENKEDANDTDKG